MLGTMLTEAALRDNRQALRHAYGMDIDLLVGDGDDQKTRINIMLDPDGRECGPINFILNGHVYYAPYWVESRT